MTSSFLLEEPEPPIFLGHTAVGSHLERLYLPLSTVLSHTLVVSRSGGGKSHTLAILVVGFAKAAAVRRLKLLAAAYLRQVDPLAPLSLSNAVASGNLVGVLDATPPISICVFDPHRDLAKCLLEDLSRMIATVRVQRRLHTQQNQKTAASQASKPSATVSSPAGPARIKRPGYWEDVLEEMLTVIDLGEREQVFGLNLLDTAMWESKENCASTLIEIFSRIYPDAWGSRMEDCFRHSIFALYLLNTCRKREQQFTILDIVPFITTDEWREELLNHPVIAEHNPAIASWWQIQFREKMNDNFRNEVIKPVLNKLNPFIGSDLLSRLFGQSKTTLDIEPLVRQGSIILIDLAASEIETESCALAGAILMGFLLKKARQVADNIPREADRPLVQLVVDEFNVILAAPYAEIMGQYRKWGVRATLATQSLALLDQLDPAMRPLVMANAANLMVLQVNAEDAEYLRRELVADGTSSKTAGLSGIPGSLTSASAGGGGLGPDLYDLVNAERGMCYVKGTFEGIRKTVFTVRVAPRPFSSQNSSHNPLQSVVSIINNRKSSAEQVVATGPGSSPRQLSSGTSHDAGYTGSEIEIERQVIVTRVLERCRKHYTHPASEITARLNKKHRAYIELYWLKLPDVYTCELFTGFESGLAELVAGLERRMKIALHRKEEMMASANRRSRQASSNNQAKVQSQQGSHQAPGEKVQSNTNAQSKSNQTGKAIPQTGQAEEAKVTRPEQPNKIKAEATASSAHDEPKSAAGENLSPGILPFAPGHAIKAPVRSDFTQLEFFEETRQLPDGNDYRPAAQIEKQRRKEKSRKKKEWKRLVDGEEARRQGLNYATGASPFLPDAGAVTSRPGPVGGEGNSFTGARENRNIDTQ
jgi:hypothetical protein